MNHIDDFDRGVRQALDPALAPAIAGTGAVAVTVGDSPWHTRRCTRCGHTLRRGDRVRVGADGRTAEHLDPTLGCAGGDGGAAVPAGADARDFSDALLEAWPVEGGVAVVPAEDVAGLLAPPSRGFPRTACLVCAHTFRPGELVVVCPCGQGRCLSAVHRDPAGGLLCWEAWRDLDRHDRCPLLLTRGRP